MNVSLIDPKYSTKGCNRDRLIILFLSPEITLKNDFGIKGLIHYNNYNRHICFRKKQLSATFILVVKLYV